jgi:glyoxylase-like metal-dependent hydrolase (beta-lactamase superfamily II)
MTISIGDFQVEVISGGTFRMDGGAMFGVVPKVIWEKKIPPDARNRIPMETNCLLIRTGEATILIDTGYGTKGSPRERENFVLEAGDPLIEHLAAAGVTPGQVDTVILTHLHFDHVGGCTHLSESGELRPTFPHARHVVQRNEWEDATGRAPELRGAYFERDFVPLRNAGLIDVVEGDVQIAPGITVHLAPGHTHGHQVVLLESHGQRALYPCDLCPTASHLRTFWTMSYDQSLLEVRRVKPRWIGRAADEGWLLFFAHDMETRAARIRRDPEEEFVVHEIVPT